MRDMLFVSLILLVASSASADPKKESGPEKAARAWQAAVRASTPTPPPTKDKPLDFTLTNVATKSCKGMKKGHITDAPKVAKLHRCLVDTWKANAAEPTFRDWTTEDLPAAQKKAFDALGKDATLVLAEFMGDGEKLDLLIAMSADATVRAIWLEQSAFE